MTQDFFLGQLRLILIALIAFAAGKGWLSTDTTTLLGAVLAPIGLLFGPWLWSIYHNINMKLVPKDSVAVGAENVINRGTASVGSMALITSSDSNPATVAAKVVGCLLVALVLSAFLVAPAMAQTKLKLPIDPLGLNNQPPLSIIPGNKLTGSAVTDIQTFMNAKFLPDLQYALKLAQASKNNITSDCYQAWIDIITTQQNAVLDTQTPAQPLPMPDPHVITDFEKLVELRNALQPESPFMVKCSPVASMIKKDIASFMGIVLSGGAGLATLVPGL